MTVNSAENTYTSGSYSNKGVSGMASGMDTEGLVKSMLSGIQSRIDKQSQEQTILEWKQEEYRDIITDINEFKDKYFSTSGTNPLVMPSTFKTATAESSSSGVKVSATSEAVEGNFEISEITQLADSAKFTSNAVGTVMTAKLDATKFKSIASKINIEVSGVTPPIEVDISGAESESDIVGMINNRITQYNKTYGKSISITASLDSDKKIIYSGTGDSSEFTVDGSATGTEKTGTITTGKYNAGNKITVKSGSDTVELDLSGKSESEILSLINNDSILQEKGISAALEDGKLKLTASDSTTSFSVSGTKVGLTTIGLKQNATSESGSITAENSTSIADNKFSIDGTEISYAADASLDDIVTAINDKAIAGLTASVVGGALKLSGDNTNSNFTITGTAAELAKFGIENNAESTITSKFTVTPTAIETTGTLGISYNGVTKGISITNTDTLKSFQEKLFDAFGSGITIDSDGEFHVGNGQTVSLSGKDELFTALGINKNESSNYINTSKSLNELFNSVAPTEESVVKFNINDIDFTFTGRTSLADVMQEINDSRAGVTMTYNALNNKFNLKSVETGSQSKINVTDGDGGLINTLFGQSSIVADGKDAKLKIDGEDVIYSKNNIEYNGVNLTLRDKSTDPVTIDVARDTGKALDAIKAFASDYNKLIDDLNKRIHEEATYKKYPPLTDAQKDEMTEEEIKKWDEKSKKGLLKGDSDIASFLDEMRAAIYTKVGDSLTLADIGVTSSSQWNEYGKLSINSDKLEDSLKNNMQEVSKIFTGSNGLATRLNDVCKKAANTSSASPGALVSMAGMKGKATEKKNIIYDRINTIKDRVKKLKEQYEARKKRYWDQFNSMETALSNMNSTSSWLTSMINGG